jgi:hypothetical protein
VFPLITLVVPQSIYHSCIGKMVNSLLSWDNMGCLRIILKMTDHNKLSSFCCYCTQYCVIFHLCRKATLHRKNYLSGYLSSFTLEEIQTLQFWACGFIMPSIITILRALPENITLQWYSVLYNSATILLSANRILLSYSAWCPQYLP